MQIELVNSPKTAVIGVVLFEGQEAKTCKQYGVSEFKAKQNVSQIVVATTDKKIIFGGLGKKELYNEETLKKAVAKIVSVASQFKVKEITIDASTIDKPMASSTTSPLNAIIQGAALSQYAFSKYKSQTEEIVTIEKLCIVTNAKAASVEVSNEVKNALTIVNAVNYTREIANEPANVATPTFLANEALKLKNKNVTVTILDKKKLEELGCNAILSVAAGSVQPPTMAIIDYKPQKYTKTIAFVGKGITFDSGGISIKPSKAMDEMKFDKSGACAVIGALKAINEMQLPIHVIGVFAATENLPSGSASKPGDIVKAYNGKTIEILNTDAEGRLILSDALAYTEKNYKPDYMVDISTLTGACVVALGQMCSGLMANNEAFADQVMQAGNETGDRCWKLPLWPEYEEKIKADNADVKNLGDETGAGTIIGAAFLKQFVEKTPWVHLDVAGTAWTTQPRGYYAKGATGVGVRLFVKLCENLAKS